MVRVRKQNFNQARNKKQSNLLILVSETIQVTNNDRVQKRRKICKALGIETTDKWYTHMPKAVYEKGDVTVLWNQAVHTEREVTANRPDLIIKNKKEKTCTLIDVAIPADRNDVQMEAEKKLKCKSLCIEIQRM